MYDQWLDLWAVSVKEKQWLKIFLTIFSFIWGTILIWALHLIYTRFFSRSAPAKNMLILNVAMFWAQYDQNCVYYKNWFFIFVRRNNNYLYLFLTHKHTIVKCSMACYWSMSFFLLIFFFRHCFVSFGSWCQYQLTWLWELHSCFPCCQWR